MSSNTQHDFLCGTAAIFAGCTLIAFGVYILSSFDPHWLIISECFCIAMTPFCVYIWRRPEVKKQNMSDWFRSVLWIWLLLGVLLLGDFLVGEAARPGRSFWVAATSTIGFSVTVFLSPLGIAILTGCIRAYLLEHISRGHE